jgi:hypothetical protein
VFTLDDALERLGPVPYAVKTETHGEREAGEERSGKSYGLGWSGRTRNSTDTRVEWISLKLETVAKPGQR